MLHCLKINCIINVEGKIMVLHLIPTILLGGFDPASLLSGLDFIELIFGILNQVTFLVDVFIAAALVGALVRGIFKNFWKVLWRGIIFVILIAALYIVAGNLVNQVGALPLSLKGDINGVATEWKSLREILEGVALTAGNNQDYATAMTDVILKNLVIFLGVPLVAIVTPIVSGITYPIIGIFLPKRWKKIKLIPVKLALSLGLSVIAIIVFAIPMATLVPPLTAIRDTIADDTLMKKFMNPELIGFLELFTVEKSILLKIINLGNVAGSLNIFNSFVYAGDAVKLSDALPTLFAQLNTIAYAAAGS